MIEYLKLPLRFEEFFQRKKLETCSLKDSIARNLHLLITTQLEENKQDLSYGSPFWDHEYDIHLSNDARREIVLTSLTKQILKYEKRIANPVVEVFVKLKEYQLSTGMQARRRIEIVINGSLKRNDEPFSFQTGFFIGPLLFD